jgi:hypothetical protein
LNANKFPDMTVPRPRIERQFGWPIADGYLSISTVEDADVGFNQPLVITLPAFERPEV